MQVSDDLYLGPVFAPSPKDPNAPSSPQNGLGPMGRVYVFDVVPVTSGAALLAALQTTAGAGNLVLTAGAGVTTRFDINNVLRLVLDCARRLTLTSAGNLSAISFTFIGYDIYGQRMTQTIAGPNANTVATTKTFKELVSVSASAAVGTNVSVGFNDALGLPVRLTDAGYISDPKWAGALAQDNGTFVAADTTSPASPTTGDVRGVYTPSSAANGVRRLVMGLYLTGSQVGPNATRLAALGVDQA